MSGKRYPEKFKIEAVKQVVDRGYSVSSVAKRLLVPDEHPAPRKYNACIPVKP
ncbi:transposase [Pantoea ananatis]|uniref:transposase n=1 Tax=Pantoea ananas TaxID=553 RepID=UPI003D155BFB